MYEEWLRLACTRYSSENDNASYGKKFENSVPCNSGLGYRLN